MYKVGLITIHDTINFGSQLQTFSLYKAVESLGIDVKLIDYKCEAISERESTHPLAEVKNVKDFIKFLVLHKNLEKRKQEFHKFMDKNMSITKQYDKSTIKNNQWLNFLFQGGIVLFSVALILFIIEISTIKRQKNNKNVFITTFFLISLLIEMLFEAQFNSLPVNLVIVILYEYSIAFKDWKKNETYI